ncbi:MAG: hypothetical protein AABX85_01985 [Nanoarchaeota archaeon]
MAEAYVQQPFSSDSAGKIRDVEEKQRLLKDRVLLIGQSLIEERDRTFKELQELKKNVTSVKEDNNRIKELLERVVEQLNGVARKEELAIIQRQLDLIRK